MYLSPFACFPYRSYGMSHKPRLAPEWKQALANKYQYGALTQLMEEACRL